MGKFRALFSAIFAGSLLLCVGLAPSAKADSITPNSFSGGVSVFTGVNIYYVDKTASANPWGLTVSCSVGCNTNPFGSDASTPFEVSTVSFGSAALGASSNFIEINPGVIAVFLVNGTSIFAGGNTGNPILESSGAIATWATQSGTGHGWALNGNPSDSGGILTYEGSGVFLLTDTSLNVAFQLLSATQTSFPTPEPSSLLMLGSGLLGLIGFGLRRKAIV
jgi:PEP-CTERM motif